MKPRPLLGTGQALLTALLSLDLLHWIRVCLLNYTLKSQGINNKCKQEKKLYQTLYVVSHQSVFITPSLAFLNHISSLQI